MYSSVQWVAGDTILEGGKAAGSANNCSSPVARDRGHNLEDTTPDQCGFDAGDHDLIGVNPALGALTVNSSGPPTEALASGSQARGAGGQCTEPLSTPADNPLTVDERGLPRGNPCDIGAFQSEPPTVVSGPGVSGIAVPTQTLTCITAWRGDHVALAYQWLLDAGTISGAAARTYVVRAGDLRHRLACRVNASGDYGSRSATSAAVRVTNGFPVLTRRPAVKGVLRPGRTVTCDHGRWSGVGALMFGYRWRRDGKPISLEHGSRYVLQRVDAGHKLACRVTAADRFGDTNALSNPVRVPSLGVVHVASQRDMVAADGSTRVKLRCTGGLACVGKLLLSYPPAGKAAHVLARAALSVAPGRTARIRLRLNKRGRGLLAAAHGGTLKVRVTVLTVGSARHGTITLRLR